MPGCRSLKEKRRRLRPVLAHLRQRMELSVSEVGSQDAWQKATVGIAVVAPQAHRLGEIIEGVRRYALGLDDMEMVHCDVFHLEEQ